MAALLYSNPHNNCVSLAQFESRFLSTTSGLGVPLSYTSFQYPLDSFFTSITTTLYIFSNSVITIISSIWCETSYSRYFVDVIVYTVCFTYMYIHKHHRPMHINYYCHLYTVVTNTKYWIAKSDRNLYFCLSWIHPDLKEKYGSLETSHLNFRFIITESFVMYALIIPFMYKR